jgi:hypothetical protein
MADENITDVQRQLSAAMLQVQNDLNQFGRVTQQSAEQLKDAEMKAKYGIDNFTKGTNTAAQVLGALAGAGIESTKAMYEGKKGAAAFNSSLDELSKAAALAGTALTLLIPGGIVMKAVIGGLTMAATATIAYTKAANDMADKLYKGYSDLAQSGAAASDGMTGVFDDAKKMGLSMNQLDSMIGQVAASSRDFVLFGGTVADGRKQLADMSLALKGSREGFFKLGLSQEAQNEAMSGYMRLQARTGNMQKQTTDQLAASARNYITEQDALARITGMSVKDQQKAREDALMEEQFLAKVRQLQREGKNKEAKELQDANILMSAMGDEVGKGYRAIVNGNLRDENARKFQMATQGKGLEAAQKLSDGQIKASEAAQMVGKGMQGYLDSQGDQLAQLGVVGQYATNYAQVVKGAAMSQQDYNATLQKAQDDQEKMLKNKGDAVTSQYSGLIKKQQDINEKLEKDVFAGIPNAVSNMNRLAGVTDKLADGFSLLTKGINGLLNMIGLGQKREVTGAEIKADKELEQAKKEYEESLKNASFTQKMGLGLDEKMQAAREKMLAAQERRDQEETAAVRAYKAAEAKGQVSGGRIVTSSAASGGSAPTSVADLKAQGLKIKEGDVQGSGNELSPKIVDLAKKIQSSVEGFGYFSGFNDQFHNEKASSSKHTKGLAADFTLAQKPTPEQGKELVSWLNSQGASLAIDEYNNPSSKATAGHIHVEIPTFAEGGELAAGKLGIAGEAGPEFVQGPATITSSNDIMSAFNNMAAMIGKQTGAIDELIRVAKNSNDIQTKILRIQA